MSTWRIERHYGFGAAQIPIQPEPHRVAQMGFSQGLAMLVGEVTEGGVIATIRRGAGESTTILLSLLIMLAFIVTLARDHSDRSAIEVVLLETAEPMPTPIVEAVEEPVPIPVEIPKLAPPAPVAPERPISPQRIAERPKPAPPEAAQPKPKARRKPIITQMAKVAAPKPSPLAKIDRARRQRPQPIAKTRVEIDPTRSRPEPSTARAERLARLPVDRANPLRTASRPNAPAAPAFDLPKDESPRRAFRVASAKSAPGERPGARRRVAPAAPNRAETASLKPGPRAPRQSGPRPTGSRAKRKSAPTLASASAPSPRRAPVATAKRVARVAPATSLRQTPGPRVEVEGAAYALESNTPTPASRSGRAAAWTPRGQKGDRTAVAGVPLAELAACLSDREEDRLKQSVVAAVTTQQECVSRKGTYRFIETKNLNAFLMWIDRAPERPASDRCVELGYALECLQSASRRAAR